MSTARRGGVDNIVLISGGAGDPEVLAGTVDPSAGGGVAAPEGSIYLRFGAGAGEQWVKTGALDTDWGGPITGGAAGAWTSAAGVTSLVTDTDTIQKDLAGNPRGADAVDLQRIRSIVIHVASGDRASIVAGQRNRADSAGDFVGAGEDNVSSGPQASTNGDLNTASGTNSKAWGRNNQATATTSTAFGDSCQAIDSQSLAHGEDARTNFIGSRAFANGQFGAGTSNLATAQFEEVMVRRETTDDTPTDLTIDGGVPGAFNRLDIPDDDTTWAVEAWVTAREEGGANASAVYQLKAAVKRDTGVATVALIGAVDQAFVREDVVAWDATIVADAVNGGIAVQVTGVLATNINWAAHVMLRQTRETV